MKFEENASEKCGKHECAADHGCCENTQGETPAGYDRECMFLDQGWDEGYCLGAERTLQRVRDILDMDYDEIRECFGEEYETGWEVIEKCSAEQITTALQEWASKKENTATIEKLLKIFDDSIIKEILAFIEALGLIKHMVKGISINYSSDSGNLTIGVTGIEPFKEAE